MNLGKIEFGPEVMKSGDKKEKRFVNSKEPIFSDIQDSTFSSVFITLKEKGRIMREKYEQRHGMNLSDMKEFIANELQSLQSQHKSLALRMFHFDFVFICFYQILFFILQCIEK